MCIISKAMSRGLVSMLLLESFRQSRGVFVGFHPVYTA